MTRFVGSELSRLFDPERDPDELVREDDWHPSDDPAWREFDLGDSVRKRRRWYHRLVDEGLL